jgi:hypothetical protein
MNGKVELKDIIERIDTAIQNSNMESLIYTLGDLIGKFNGYFFINPADIVYVRHFTNIPESCEVITIITRHGLHLSIRIYASEGIVEDVEVIHL